MEAFAVAVPAYTVVSIPSLSPIPSRQMARPWQRKEGKRNAIFPSSLVLSFNLVSDVASVFQLALVVFSFLYAK